MRREQNPTELMRVFYVIFSKELRSFFSSPLAYVVIGLFGLLNAWLFVSIVTVMSMSVTPRSLVYNLFDSGWFWMGFCFLFPVLTMRLFAEEQKMGTLETLLTAPVRTIQVVMAKYFATVTVYLAALVPVFLLFLLFRGVTGQAEAFHGGALFGAAVGLILIGMANIALGVLCSAMTSNQIIAAMVCFAVIMLHYFLGFFQYFGGMPGSLMTAGLGYVSNVDHMRSFSEGLIDSRPFIYYLSFTALLLAMTHHVLEFRRWRV